MLETILKMGREAGFPTIEAFGEKVRRQESDGADRALSLHEVESDRVLVRAFRDTGEPLGLSLSAPDPRQVKAGLAGLASGPVLDRRKNFAHLLPRHVQKVKVGIFDPEIEQWDESRAADLRERLRECLVTFPGLRLKKFQFARALKKVYLANSLGFFAKYKKTLYQVQASFMLKDHALELSESRTYFRDFDPQRLVARGANLLGALAADPEPEVIPGEFVVMSPEASAQVLKEFSPGLKLERAAPRGHGTAASARVSIIDNGAMDGQPGSAPFDDEGTASGEKYLVNKGVALGRVADIRSAFSAGGRPTGNGFRDERGVFPQPQFSNLFIRPGNDSLAQLLQQARQGVLVYLVKPKGAGRQAGELLFSAYGYFFSGDGIARPVHFRFATSMRSYLLHVLAVSRELRFFHSRANIGSPYLLLQGRPGPGKDYLI